jgi:DNA-directed RNA polymerase subunit N (RpoN/RPB10)
MPYVKCPTCRRLIGNKYIILRKAYNDIDNSILSDDEKREKRTDVLNSLDIKRICCKSRLASFINTEEYLK